MKKLCIMLLMLVLSVFTFAANVGTSNQPSVEQLYKVTGPVVKGNRLVLRTMASGKPSFEYEWKFKAKGKSSYVTYAKTTEPCLDIAKVGDSNIGDYKLVVKNAYGQAVSEPFTVSYEKSGAAVQWGSHSHGRTTPPEGLSKIVSISSGMNCNIAMTSNGKLYSWGYNAHGVCDIPQNLNNVNSITIGGYDSINAAVAVKNDGRVVVWGNTFEERWYTDWVEHNGVWREEKVYYTNGYDVATLIKNLSNVVQVSVGDICTMVLKKDGTISVHGDDSDYTFKNYLSKIPNEAKSNIVAVATAGYACMALRADGKVFVWTDEYCDSWLPPSGLKDVVQIGVQGSYEWENHFIALKRDGTIVVWGKDWYVKDGVYTGNYKQVSVGEEHFVALDSAGKVHYFGYNWNYDLDKVPTYANSAYALSSGGYHVSAIVSDKDLDGVCDNEELYLGRNPNVWENPYKVNVVGSVYNSANKPIQNAKVNIYFAANSLSTNLVFVGSALTDKNGKYEIPQILPSQNYYIQVKADGYVDEWYNNKTLKINASKLQLGSLTKSTNVLKTHSVGKIVLDNGQAPAYGVIKPFVLGESGTSQVTHVKMATGSVVYLDMWPVSSDKDGAFLLGEVSASHPLGPWYSSKIYAQRLINVNLDGKKSIRPKTVQFDDGAEGEFKDIDLQINGSTGSVKINTKPQGATVYVDYADEPLGVTPLVVNNLLVASHAHVLLLEKDGYLRPRPIWFDVTKNKTIEVTVPLTKASKNVKQLSAKVTSTDSRYEVYVDYLPTGKVTPVVVGGMDPASHSGKGWRSSYHTIMLKGNGLLPLNPMYILDDLNNFANNSEFKFNTKHLDCYSVSFNANGGTGSMATQVIPVDTATKLYTNTFKRSGYTFIGWSKKKNGAVAYKDAASVKKLASKGTVTLYAVWAKTKYKVAFYANGGSGKMSAQAMAYNKAAYLSKNKFKRSGYVFAGWAKTPTGGIAYKNTQAVKNLTTKGGTVKLYAVWAKSKYKVAFYANGGKGKMSAQTMTYNKAAYLKKNAFKRTGYVFAGWAKTKTGSVVYTNGKAVKNLTIKGGTVKLYARWKPITYKIAFYPNGAIGKVITQAMTYNKAAYLKKNAFKRTGYTFQGWAKSVALAKKGKVAYKNRQAVKNLLKKSGTVKLIAVWKPVTYKVAFYANGGIGKTVTQTMTYNRAAYLKKNAFKRTGYTFLGWAKKKNGVVAYKNAVAVKNLLSAKGTIKLYAVWAKTKYKVAFYANGGSGSMSAQAMTYNKAAYLKKNAFKRTGYTFAGWAKSVNGSVVYKDGKAVKNLTTTGATIKLYAVWKPITYNVAFYPNGGTGSGVTQSMTYNKAANLRSNTFTRTGYTFAGWSKSTTGSVAYSNGQSVKNLSSTNNATIKLYAVWKPNTYKVTFYPNGASASAVTQTMTYNTAVNLRNNTFTRSGYTFAGWAMSATGSVAYSNAASVKNISSTNNATIKLYAVWKEIKYVQLWENGPYWAETNIGAENPEDYGYYFWWGDTIGYKRENDQWVASDGSPSTFSFDDYNTPTYDKYNSELQSEGWIASNGVLAPEHDAAQVHWGANWRMPTDSELQALWFNCTWTWTTKNGVNGYVVSGKGAYSGASIFLPAAGRGFGTSLRSAGSYGSYWSSVPYSDSYYSCGIDFDSSYLEMSIIGYDRDYGHPVRPVSDVH